MDEKGWGALIAAVPTLDPADQLTLFHNVNAALRGGTATASDFFAVTHNLAPIAQWDVVGSDQRSSFNVTDALHDLRVTGVLSAADMPAYQAFIRRDFGPRLAPLGLAAKPGETVADVLMREALVQLLVEEGRDPALTAQLAKAAHVYLASDGKDTGGIAPELVQEAMRAGVVSEGAPFSDQLLAALQKSDDEYFVSRAIYALAGAQDEASLDKLLALSLTPTIRTGDIRYVWRYMSAEDKGRTVLWTWFKANIDALEKRVSSQGLSGAPDILKFGCDAATKSDLDAFFGPRTGQLEGTPRTLKENDDRIDRCIAFKAAKGVEIEAALKVAK
jgi:alanyl aminopeptidase